MKTIHSAPALHIFSWYLDKLPIFHDIVMENVVKSLNEHNKGLRKLIERGADEVGQLEQFEDKFRTFKKNFEDFRKMVIKKEERSDELQIRLNKKYEDDCRVAEEIKCQISNLRHEIEEQDLANEKIHLKLKDNIEKFHKLNSVISDHTDSSVFVGCFQMESSPFIERLRQDLNGH